MTRTLKTALLLTATACLLACGSAVSQANYDKIKEGMTTAEVEAILGKPTKTDSTSAAGAGMALSGKTAVWTSGDKQITILFLNDKVQMKTAKGL